MIGRLALAGLLALTVSACERDNPKLFNIRKADRTPDEFSILPTRPLETPPDLAVLNGGTAADRALIGTAGRYGVDPAIRGQLAAEDLDFRRANDGRLLERVFNVNVYFKAYESQSLDQYAELYRLRRAGVRTVAAPPDPATVQ